MKLTAVLMSCLLLASNAAAMPAFAEDALPTVAGAALDITRVTLSLSEQPAETQNGFIQTEDGSVAYYVEGEKLTGHFSVTTDYVKGDLEGSGTVDAEDASCILIAAAESAVSGISPQEYLAEVNEQISTSYQAEQVADINDDGQIDASDAAELLVYVARIGAGEHLNPLGCGQFYADKNGILQQGWIKSGSEVYYAGEDYALAEGWTELDGNSYYFSENAVMQKGYLQYNDCIYYMGADGAMVTGWLDTGDAMYYFDTENGAQAFGVTEISESLYYFDETGALLTGGWLTTKDGVRYADDRGVLLTSFQTIDDAQYYFYGDGTMASGISAIGDDTYYFTEDGVQQFGWQELADGMHYFDDTTGIMAVGFTQMEDGTRYFTEEGVMLTDWQEIGSDRYYFDTEGLMATGLVVMDGEKYRFEENGIYHPITICLDAGHYAKYNHSPVNDAYWESDFTWKIHLYLKEALEGYGIEVITTREDKDTDLGLSARGYASEGCDLFLSLHSNACGIESVDGPLACCTVTGTADELGQMLADLVAEVMETNDPGKIWKRQGKDGDWYSVLWGATKVGTPAILLEHSYHTNKRATAWLLDDDNVKRMAEAEAALLAEYFGMK